MMQFFVYSLTVHQGSNSDLSDSRTLSLPDNMGSRNFTLRKLVSNPSSIKRSFSCRELRELLKSKVLTVLKKYVWWHQYLSSVDFVPYRMFSCLYAAFVFQGLKKNRLRHLRDDHGGNVTQFSSGDICTSKNLYENFNSTNKIIFKLIFNKICNECV